MYDYRESICDDIREYIRENVTLTDYADREALEEFLNEELWTNDSVTGNASGSYTFNAWKAEENLCHNLDLLAEVLDEFGGDAREMLDSPESADVSIRCYLLAECITTVLDEMEDELEEAFASNEETED